MPMRAFWISAGVSSMTDFAMAVQEAGSSEPSAQSFTMRMLPMSLALTRYQVLEAGWKELARWQMPQSTWQDEKPLSLAVPTTTAAAFRLTYVHAHPIVESSARFFSGARPANYEAEAAQVLRALMPGVEDSMRDGEAVDPETVVDLTGRLGTDGRLDWAPPSGRWTVLRIGNVNAGIRNHPAPPEATGWECDKLSTAGADASYDGYIGKLSAGALSGGLLG